MTDYQSAKGVLEEKLGISHHIFFKAMGAGATYPAWDIMSV